MARSTATATATTNGHTTTANGYTTTYAALHIWHTVPFRAKTTYTTHTPLPRHVLGRVLIEHAPAVVGGDTSGDHHGGREDEQREAGHSALPNVDYQRTGRNTKAVLAWGSQRSLGNLLGRVETTPRVC